MNFIDNLLNRITMYRLMYYYLLALIVIAAIFGVFKIMPYDPVSLIVSMFIFIGACWATNQLFAKIFRVSANVESVYITAFILTLIISPVALVPWNIATILPGLGFILAASAMAMASKYLIAINRKHIFNPAAFAVVVTGFAMGQYASWWIGGNLPMLAFVVIGGLLILRKIQRFDLFWSFFVAALASILWTSATGGFGFDPTTTIEKALIHTSLLFVGFVMITEPLSTPPNRPLRIAYGALVGILFSPAVHIGPIYSTPELALVAGNIFSYIVSPKGKYALTLKSKREVGADSYDFAFAPEASRQLPSFKPGQYMEFTLAGEGADLRGNRRYFTIASSSTESELHLGVKFHNPSSTFKQKLLALEPGEKISAGQLAGDFILPREFTSIGKTSAAALAPKKLAFIAGGIGITPFRSMVKYLSDIASDASLGHGGLNANNLHLEENAKNTPPAVTAHPDVVLLYSNRRASEISYREVFDEAATKIHLKTVYVNTDTEKRIDADLIRREVPDYSERTFYISGTHAMVETFKKTLRELGIPRTHIKTDFFPGFA